MVARILLVDDHDSFRSGASRVLERAGHEVVSACSGKEAIRILETYWPDLVITDVSMPEMDGIEVILTLQDRRPDLPVLVISGGGVLPHQLLLDNAMALGARRALSKPFTPEELLGAVADLLVDPDS